MKKNQKKSGTSIAMHIIITGVGVASAGSLLLNPVTLIPSIAVIAAFNYGYKRLEEWA